MLAVDNFVKILRKDAQVTYCYRENKPFNVTVIEYTKNHPKSRNFNSAKTETSKRFFDSIDGNHLAANPNDAAEKLSAKATNDWNNRNFTASRERFHAAYKICEKDYKNEKSFRKSRQHAKAAILNVEANKLHAEKNFTAAIVKYRDALEICPKTLTCEMKIFTNNIASSLNNLGVKFDNENDFEKALLKYKEAVAESTDDNEYLEIYLKNIKDVSEKILIKNEKCKENKENEDEKNSHKINENYHQILEQNHQNHQMIHHQIAENKMHQIDGHNHKISDKNLYQIDSNHHQIETKNHHKIAHKNHHQNIDPNVHKSEIETVNYLRENNQHLEVEIHDNLPTIKTDCIHCTKNNLKPLNKLQDLDFKNENIKLTKNIQLTKNIKESEEKTEEPKAVFKESKPNFQKSESNYEESVITFVDPSQNDNFISFCNHLDAAKPCILNKKSNTFDFYGEKNEGMIVKFRQALKIRPPMELNSKKQR